MSKKKNKEELCSIILLDTSILLNLLEIPDRCQEKEAVQREFENYPEEVNRFILPFSTIWETGNFIAHIKTGKDVRKKYALLFCELVKDAMTGKAPFRVVDPPKNEDVLEWLTTFPEAAGSDKSPKKPTEGISWGDHSIIQTFEKLKKKMKMTSIKIWSIDRDLSHFQYIPN